MNIISIDPVKRAAVMVAAALGLGACAAIPGAPAAQQPLQPCGSGADAISKFEALQATPAPAATKAPAAAPANPAPTATPRPAPAVDRVGFPTGYLQSFKLLYVFDRGPNGQVRVICGNDTAASAKSGEGYPYGSVLVMETYRARQQDGKIVTDDRGRFVREALAGVFVMKKDRGFGADYGQWRSGEWEYVAFRPGSTEYATAPQASNACAACHAHVTDKKLDYTFRAGSLQFAASHFDAVPAPQPNQVVMTSMAFGPNTISIKKGTKVTFANRDIMNHTVTAVDKSFDSGNINVGAEWSHTFDTAGSFDYICTYHPDQMRARIVVTE